MSKGDKLFYVLKTIVTKGWEQLINVEGKYVIIVINPNQEVYILKKGIPLFYDKNILCSEKIGKLEELEDNVVKGWTNRLIKKLGVDKNE